MQAVRGRSKQLRASPWQQFLFSLFFRTLHGTVYLEITVQRFKVEWKIIAKEDQFFS